MTRGLFNWTAEDVVRFLKDRGFVLTHTKGSHCFYVVRSGGVPRQACVPFHGSRTIKPRNLKGIILQSGIPKNEWMSK